MFMFLWNQVRRGDGHGSRGMIQADNGMVELWMDVERNGDGAAAKSGACS